jgi:hypothetical protein
MTSSVLAGLMFLAVRVEGGFDPFAADKIAVGIHKSAGIYHVCYNRLHDLEPQSIPELLRERTAAAPDKPFLFPKSTGGNLPTREFADVVRRVAGMLWGERRSQRRRGESVTAKQCRVRDCVFCVLAHRRTRRAINSLLKAQEIEYVISNSESKVLLINSGFLSVIEKD